MSCPIEPQDYVVGVTVVDIGDLRVARGMTRRPTRNCRHLRLVYYTNERRVYCEDCESDVEPFDAFLGLVERFHHFEAKHRQITEAARTTLISRAAKRMDEAFRSRSMVPICPHCSAAIFPEDVADGVGMTSKDFAMRRRGAQR